MPIYGKITYIGTKMQYSIGNNSAAEGGSLINLTPIPPFSTMEKTMVITRTMPNVWFLRYFKMLVFATFPLIVYL